MKIAPEYIYPFLPKACPPLFWRAGLGKKFSQSFLSLYLQRVALRSDSEVIR